MIQQIFLMLLMFILGWTLISPWFHHTQHRNIIPFVAIFAGCSFYTAFLFLCLVIQGYTGWSINTSFILITLLSLVLIGLILKKYSIIYKELNFYEYCGIIFWIFIIITAGFFFSKFNYAVDTADSHRYIQLGEGLALSGFKSDGPFIWDSLLTKRPIFYSMFHALSRPFQIDYLWILLPAYSTFFIITCFWLTKEMVDSLYNKSTWFSFVFSLSGALLIFSSSFMILNFYYINNHMFTSIHFTLFFLLAWTGLYHNSDNLLILATIILLPTILMRFENILLVLIFGTMLASFRPAGRFVRIIFYLCGLSVAIVSFLYFITLSEGASRFISEERMFLTGLMGLLVSAGGSLIGRWNWSTNTWEWIRPYIPHAILLIAVLVVSQSFLFHFETAGLSIPIMMQNILHAKIWNHFWYLIIFLFILFWTIPNSKEYRYQGFITSGIFIFILLTIELSHLRGSAYRISPNDSANRMMVHIVPLIIAHFAMAAANFLSKEKQGNLAEMEKYDSKAL